MSQLCGLSPRVRGSHERALESGHGLGSIPASAGQPQQGDDICGERPVYPRECGAAICGHLLDLM